MNYSDTILTKEDKELLRYCELHCQTDRALFGIQKVNKLLELMGEEIYDVNNLLIQKLIPIHGEQMEEIIKKIKVRKSKNKWLFPEKVILNLNS
ncbi:MAG: hypothetical protein KJ646_01175 [Nanoarchaeota archaeon]|nr:hypothetical protein [Nanoarchaeota archaeon]MBU4116738.1 hypothetical protein [Nanoarchaeota archaeon]